MNDNSKEEQAAATSNSSQQQENVALNIDPEHAENHNGQRQKGKKKREKTPPSVGMRVCYVVTALLVMSVFKVLVELLIYLFAR